MNAEQAAIGNRPRVGDREALGSGACCQEIGLSVPHQTWLEFCEPIRGIRARQHRQNRDHQRLAEILEGSRSSHHGMQIADGPIVHRTHRNDVLGQNIQRIVGDAHRFQGTFTHAACDGP